MQSNKPIILFLIKFFVSYFLLLGLYSYYLNHTQIKDSNTFSCALITKNVAEQSAFILNLFGYKTKVMQHDKELSFKILVNGNYVARVIEGCNSISIIILFLAFIIAFKGSIKNTIWFGLLGAVLIYLVNLIRIGVLAVGLYKFPKQEAVLHDLIFPAIIYGMVVLLWIIWVNRFSNYGKRDA